MQKVNFNYEVLIGEDCSTDRSKEILKQIEKRCPPNFHFFYRDTNYGIQKNFTDLYARTVGEYLTVVEGDDYWTDDNKLQKQIDFLDNNPDYFACAHDVYVVDEFSRQTCFHYPSCHDVEYTLRHFERNILPGQTASIVLRNYYLPNSSIDRSILDVKYYAGDRRVAFLIVMNGKVRCFQEKMAAYRYVTTKGSSFSANMKESTEIHLMDVNFAKAMMDYAYRHKNKEAEKVATTKYILSLYGLMRFNRNELSLFRFLVMYIRSNFKMHILLHFLWILFVKKKDSHEVK